jgi:hypothetical protein
MRHLGARVCDFTLVDFLAVYCDIGWSGNSHTNLAVLYTKNGYRDAAGDSDDFT